MTDENQGFGKKKGPAQQAGSQPVKIVPKSPNEALQPQKGPPPPKRAKQARNRFVVAMNFMFSCLVFMIVLMAFGFYFGKNMFEEAGPLQEERTIQVREGDSLGTIAARLETRGIISNNLIFRIGVKMYKAAGSMKVGEYSFSPHMSMHDVMETIRTGKGILYKLSIPEGWTNYQIYKRLAESPELAGDLPPMLPEGSLLPDTYPYTSNTTRKELIARMQTAQSSAVTEIWAKRAKNLPISTPEEMVILASIVEKETAKADERPRVASVFLNRIRDRMRLQSDPTIIYGLFGGEGKPADRPILKSDIDKETPYNTYTILGLPPTPIGNPGRASMEAVANPSITNDLYFVADGSGGHVFSETLAEHQANVKRWRDIERRMQKTTGSTQ